MGRHFAIDVYRFFILFDCDRADRSFGAVTRARIDGRQGNYYRQISVKQVRQSLGVRDRRSVLLSLRSNKIVDLIVVSESSDDIATAHCDVRAVQEGDLHY